MGENAFSERVLKKVQQTIDPESLISIEKIEVLRSRPQD
jgi:hypothetical protein